MSRVPVSTRCDEAVWESARAAAQGMLAHDPTYSLAKLVEDALKQEVSRLAELHNEGDNWPQAAPLRRGRRLSS